MAVLAEQGHGEWQHDRLLLVLARCGGCALLGADGVGLCT